MANVTNEVIEIVRKIANLSRNDEVDTQATLKELGVDSLESVNIFLNIYEKFGIEVPDEDMDRLTTIQMIVEYIEQHLGG